MEFRDDVLALLGFGVAVVRCNRGHAVFLLNGKPDVLDVTPVIGPDDHLAAALLKRSQQLVHTVARNVNLLPIIKLHVATANLMQPHDLREGIVGGHQVALNQGERHQLHLVVVGGLLFRQLNLTAHKHLVRQVQAFILGHAKREAIELLLQLIQVAIANDLFERVRGHLALNQNGVARLERVVAVAVQALGPKELALAVQIQRGLGHRGACCNTPVPRITGHFDDALCALGCWRFDGGAFVYGHECIGHSQERARMGHALLCAECLDVHDQNAHGVHSIHHLVHLFALGLTGSGRPTSNSGLNVLRHMLWQFGCIPVAVHPFWRYDEHRVDLALVV